MKGRRDCDGCKRNLDYSTYRKHLKKIKNNKPCLKQKFKLDEVTRIRFRFKRARYVLRRL